MLILKSDVRRRLFEIQLLIMSESNVKSLLLLNSSTLSSSYSILFHCAKYWAQQGSRVLFISKAPLNNIPLAVDNAGAFLNPDAFKLIQFMYLATWEELIKQLYSIHLRHNPVSVIIVKNLENYFKSDLQTHSNEDHVSLVCASLLYAAAACAKVVSQPVFLISEYVSEDFSIEKIVIRSFFQNVWELKKNANGEGKSNVKLFKLSVPFSDEIVEFTFSKNLTGSKLSFDEVIKQIIRTC